MLATQSLLSATPVHGNCRKIPNVAMWLRCSRTSRPCTLLNQHCKQLCRQRFRSTVRASVGPSQGMGVSPELKSAIDKFIADNKIVLFMKGNRMFPQCGFSNTCVQILNTLSVPYETVNILEDELLRTGMKEYSQWPTFPQVYIDGEFYGGCDIMIESYTNGELKEHLEAALNS